MAHSEGHLEKLKTRGDAPSGLHISIYVINAARETVSLSVPFDRSEFSFSFSEIACSFKLPKKVLCEPQKT
jgi:hypothetical protein